MKAENSNNPRASAFTLALGGNASAGVRVPTPGQRIAVVGVTGSGKTTFARELARRLGYPHVELDALHWQPNWTEAPLDVFRERWRAMAGSLTQL